MNALRARIGAVRHVLAVVVGDSQHAAASRTQAIALVDQIRRCSAQLGPDDRAALVAMAVGVGWHGNDIAQVLEALAPNTRGTLRRKNQDDKDTAYYSHPTRMCKTHSRLWV
jgi:hypothetical protein